MANKEMLSKIRQYFDTEGTRISDEDKGLLCNIIDNQEKYDGFTSSVRVTTSEGRDYKSGWWSSSTSEQSRIKIDDQNFSVDTIYKHECDDGYKNDEHWDWENPLSSTNVKDVISRLRSIKDEL